MTDISISAMPIDVQRCISLVSSPVSGGIDVFIGTVRNETKGRKVVQLEFEAYESMALKELERIANDIQSIYPVHDICMHHRTGTLLPGDIAVVIAVSAAHRDAAFTACRYAIDTLKQTVPIWKREVFEDGTVWVAAHP